MTFDGNLKIPGYVALMGETRAGIDCLKLTLVIPVGLLGTRTSRRIKLPKKGVVSLEASAQHTSLKKTELVESLIEVHCDTQSTLMCIAAMTAKQIDGSI